MRRYRHPVYRFIPTWVGNTNDHPRPRANRPVHPHVGGEHYVMTNDRALYDGSSPRGWGTRSGWHFRRWRFRFIPTWVGNTRVSTLAHTAVTVHPHVGGEHRYASNRSIDVCGSSPRGWGTLAAGRCSRPSIRFIPTWVGNTHPSATNGRKPAVHPHVGGEHLRCLTAAVRKDGSSPRGWGTRSAAGCHRHDYGSSPRGWGTHIDFDASETGARFIPTWVGNTLSQSL